MVLEISDHTLGSPSNDGDEVPIGMDSTKLCDTVSEPMKTTNPPQMPRNPSASVSSEEWNIGQSVRVDYSGKNFTAKECYGTFADLFGYNTELKYKNSTEGNMNTPAGMAFDATTNYIYVCEREEDEISVWHVNGTFIFQFDVACGASSFDWPFDIALDDTYAYVTFYDDSHGRWGKYFKNNGASVATYGADGSGNGQFNGGAWGIATDGTTVWVMDGYNNDRVQYFDTSGNYQGQWGQTGSGSSHGDFDEGRDIEYDGTYVYTSDLNTYKIQKFTSTGTWVAWWGYIGSGTGKIDDVWGLWVDNNYVYSVDSSLDLVKTWTKSGSYVNRFDMGLNNLRDIIVLENVEDLDYNDYWYFSDYDADVIEVWDPNLIGVAYLFDEHKYRIDDGKSALFYYDFVGYPIAQFNTTLSFYMNGPAYPGLAGIKFSLEAIDEGTLETPFTDTYLEKSFTSTSNYGENELIVHVEIYFGYEGYQVTLFFHDTGSETIRSISTSSGSASGVEELCFSLDYVYTESRVITSYPRVEYKYTSPTTMMLRLTLEVFDYRIPIKIHTDAEFSSVSPDADTSTGSGYTWINNTVPLTYTIYFNREMDDHIYAMYDVTPDYYLQTGFDSGYSSDWSGSHGYTDEETNIVFSGTKAVKLEQYRYDYDDFLFKSSGSVLDPGFYGISFTFYRLDTYAIYFEWYNGTAWEQQSLNTTTNMWIKYFNLTYVGYNSGSYNIRFNMSGDYGNIHYYYLDDFRVWLPNGQARTTGYYNDLMETGMFATMRNIDLHDNPAVPYHPVTVYLRDRSADAQITSYSIYADEYGRIHVSFVLPTANQLNEMEYTFRIQSLISGEYIDSHFTPIPVNHYDYFMVENYTNFGFGGIDFTENWDDGATYYQSDDYQSCGYNRLNPSSATVSDFRIKFFDLQDIDASYYTHLRVLVRTNVSDLYVASYDQEGNLVGQAETLPQSTGELDWYEVTWNISVDSDWSGTENGTQLFFDEVGGDGQPESNNFVWIDQIRLYHINEPLLVETATYAYLTTDYDQFVYYVVVDDVAQNYVYDLDPFLFDLSVGSHEINVTPFLDLSRRWLCYTPADIIQITYDVAESGVMKLIYHDQSGNLLQFDRFKTYIDNIRLFDNYVYFLNVSATFNLTICDLFDNLLYSNSSEVFENFKETQLTLYSLKVQNIQENPIWFRIERGDKYYSEWIFSFEVIEYRLEQADYTIYVYYSDVAGNFNVATNGTYVSYSYTVDSDTAIRVTGTTIDDVFDNVVSLTDSVDQVNVSIHNAIDYQSQNLTLQFIATNQNLTFILENSSLIIDTLNSNFTQLFADLLSISGNVSITIDLLQALDVAFDGNMTLLINQLNSNTTTILAQMFYLEGQLDSNFTQVFADLFSISGNVSITIDLLQALDVAFEGNFTFIVNQMKSNFTKVYSDLILVNSSLHSDMLVILDQIAAIQGIYRVHFDIVDTLGIGLPWETFFIFVNDTRLYKQDMIYSNATPTILNVNARDNFNISVFNATYSITNHADVVIVVMLYEMFLFNNGNYTAYVEIYRGNHLGLNLTVPIGQAVSFRVTSGTYDYKIYYYEEEIQNINTTGSPAKPLMSWGKNLLKIGQFTVSAKMPKMIDVSTPTIQEVVAAAAGWAAFLQGFLQGVTIAAVGGAVAGFIVFTVLKEGWIGFKVGILRKAPGDSLIKPDILERKEDELEQSYLATHKSDSQIKY